MPKSSNVGNADVTQKGKKLNRKKMSLAKRVRMLEKEKETEERKHFHTVLDYTGPISITDTGYITHLSPVAQGDGVSDRVGEEIIAQYLDVHLRWTYLSGTDDSEACRMIIFRWNKENSSPSFSDILMPTLNGVGPLKKVDQPFVVDGRSAFDVLYDHRFIIDEDTGDQKNIRFKYTFPMSRKGSIIKYDGDDGSDVEKGNIYMAVMCETSAPVAGAVAQGYYRLYYKDN